MYNRIMITIFGAPGAGKTVQGQLIAQKYRWEWVSYRDLLMQLHDKDILYALDHGLFIDDDKATKLMKDVFDRLKTKTTKRLILDGFPADYRQVKWIIENKEIENLEGAIVLRVPRGELWRRLVERKRVDDTRAVIERRQDSYDRNITGMIRILTMQGIPVRQVDGGNSPNDVLKRVEEVLADWGMIQEKQYAQIRPKQTFEMNRIIDFSIQEKQNAQTSQRLAIDVNKLADIDFDSLFLDFLSSNTKKDR